MKQIWKYTIGADGLDDKMPVGAVPISVQVQGETPMLWALVDPEADVS